MVVITISYISSYTSQVQALTNQNASKQTIDNFSHNFFNTLAYILPMMYSIFICSIFANYSVIVDKAKRTIESLMASPVSVIEVWIGKSLAVAVPSFVVGIAIAIIAYIIMNFGFVVPKTGSFVVPDVLAIITAIIIIPVLIFAIVTVVIYIQLVITNPRIANFVFTGIFIILVVGVNALGGLGLSISFMPLVFLGVIVLCALISLILSRSLTTEKVLLSSKV